ncbi:MAG: hypothetical protein WCP06_12705 [Verrucomicrobiota bacterium]
MKLSPSVTSHQLVFAFGISLLLVAVAAAQDKITTKDGRTQDVKIVGATPLSVQVQVGAGIIGIPQASIAPNGIVMAAPPEVAAANAAYSAKDFPKALATVKPVLEKFKGLRVDWAKQASSLLGDIYTEMNRLPEAEAAYNDFRKMYGGQGSIQTDVGLARVAISKKDFATAKAKLEPIKERALKEKYPAPEFASAYSQTFYLLGQINEAEKEYVPALENYLRTVTLFFNDPAATSAAKERADALRKDHGITVP